MLKLIKYELRKNRTILLAITGAFLLLQLYYMYSVFAKKDGHMEASGIFLILMGWACFFAIFVLAVTNYSRELNSKSSYLIFMTPNSSYTIIFSKMLTTLLEGLLMAVLATALVIADVELYRIARPDAEHFLTLMQHVMKSLGLPVSEFLFGLLSMTLIGLVTFFAMISMIYLSVTLSATFLQNSRLKYVLGVALFLLLGWLSAKIDSLIPHSDHVITLRDALLDVLPDAALYLLILILCTTVSGWLLEKKVSL